MKYYWVLMWLIDPYCQQNRYLNYGVFNGQSFILNQKKTQHPEYAAR